jgi:2-amino-4-hydroxy-6-hydroxymethyldihydropteridine diphosphokinase
LGDREKALQAAVTSLHGPGFEVTKLSSVYETAPMDVLNQPDFLNAVLEGRTSLMPMQLLQRIMRIERQIGRKRTVAKGPRAIDIDLLLHGPFIVDTAKLQVPHPGMLQRRFVLEPLAELAPDLRHPVTKRTIREHLLAVAGQRVLRTGIRLSLAS